MTGAHGYAESRFERATRLFGLAVIAPVLLLLGLTTTLHIAQRPELGASIKSLLVVTVEPGGPADRAGLRVGDRVNSVDGRPVAEPEDFYRALAGNYEHAPVEMAVTRAGAERLILIHPTHPRQAALIQDYCLWTAGLAFLGMGWWVLLRRPDPVARNFFALCMIFAFFLLEVPDLDHGAYMVAKEHARLLLQLLLPAYVVRFFVLFPRGARVNRGESRPMRLTLLPGWLIFLAAVALDRAGLSSPGSRSEHVLSLISLAYMLAYFLGGLIHFGRHALRRDRPIQRTKMMVILAGLAAGLVPFLAVTMASNVGVSGSPAGLQYAALSLLLVPLSFGLAIMRYGALDTAFVVRVSLVYGVLTAVVVLLYLLLAVVLGGWLFSAFAVRSPHLVYVIMASSGLAVLPLRRRVQSAIDRAFYPSRRANRLELGHLAERLTGLIEADTVVATLHATLADLFRPRHLTVMLLREGAPPVFAAEAGAPHDEPAAATLATDSSLAVLLDRLRRPVFTEAAVDLLLTGEADAGSLELLTRLRASLLVPLISGNRLLGFLAFGPKQGGALYSQEDLANLRSLAVQAASVIESRRLYAASLRRRRLETELEVARGIQAELLPEAALSTPGFTICGRNEPCRTVGGDYFDYFLREDGSLALAIADVAGKGIPAALTMTSLRVAFRQEAVAGRAPRDVITGLNTLVSTLVGAESFICFFYGIWEPPTGLLRYCNAGMEPPILFRPGTGFRQQLKKGGPVLGISPDTSYREGALGLEAGDRLLLFTDGMTDQRNADGEFFDLDRLRGLVAANLNATPETLLRVLFDQVNAFGGSHKSDDKTAMLLEIKRL